MERHDIYIWPLCYDKAHLNMIITKAPIDLAQVQTEVSPVTPINWVKGTGPLLCFYCQGKMWSMSMAEMLRKLKAPHNLACPWCEVSSPALHWMVEQVHHKAMCSVCVCVTRRHQKVDLFFFCGTYLSTLCLAGSTVLMLVFPKSFPEFHHHCYCCPNNWSEWNSCGCRERDSDNKLRCIQNPQSAMITTWTISLCERQDWWTWPNQSAAASSKCHQPVTKISSKVLLFVSIQSQRHLALSYWFTLMQKSLNIDSLISKCRCSNKNRWENWVKDALAVPESSQTWICYSICP